MIEVYLYKVGRNLNRAYRTCEAFGVEKLYLIDCKGEVEGSLFKATNRIELIHTSEMPEPLGLLALETFFKNPLRQVVLKNKCNINKIIIGGETSGLPRKMDAEYKATIPMSGCVSGLTVEASLAITLYEISFYGL